MAILTRIGLSGLTANRLDPTYYRPEHLRDAQLRAGWTQAILDELRCPSVPIVYGVLKPDDRGGKFRVAKAERFEGMFVSAEDCDPVSEEMFHEFGRAEAIEGDLLIAIGGYVGRPAMLRVENGLRVVVNRHLARVRIDQDRADLGWVLAYFSSAHGERQLTREITGSVQAGINLCDLRLVDIPLPSDEAQRYIGDKVRQAEWLRERARRLVGNVKEHHARLIPEFRPTRERWNTFRLGSSAIDDVLVPHFYPPAVTEYLTGRHSKSIGQLCQTVYSGETYDADMNGVDQATSRSCSGRFLRRPCNRVCPPSRTDLDLQQHDLLLTNAAHDKGYIGKDITYYHGGPRNIPSAKVMVLRPNRTIVPASYVFAYLQTPVGYLQIQSAIRGISAGIRAEDVASIRIPLPTLTEEEHREWMAIDEKMVEAGVAEETANLLCAVSTQIVERLIEGRFSEADLIGAQKALDAGDRSADREILKALRQSDAPGAKPLIADVDGLYALLDDSEGQDP